MTVGFYFENIGGPEKMALENYFQEKKISRLEKLLQHGYFELAKFVANAKYHKRHDFYIVRLGLILMSKNYLYGISVIAPGLILFLRSFIIFLKKKFPNSEKYLARKK